MGETLAKNGPYWQAAAVKDRFEKLYAAMTDVAEGDDLIVPAAQEMVILAHELAKIASVVRVGNQFFDDDVVNGRHGIL